MMHLNGSRKRGNGEGGRKGGNEGRCGVYIWVVLLSGGEGGWEGWDGEGGGDAGMQVIEGLHLVDTVQWKLVVPFPCSSCMYYRTFQKYNHQYVANSKLPKYS